MRYEVRLFYADDAPPPFKPGEMAIHTWNEGEHSRDMEIVAGLARREIGLIEWRRAATDTEPAGAWSANLPLSDAVLEFWQRNARKSFVLPAPGNPVTFRRYVPPA